MTYGRALEDLESSNSKVLPQQVTDDLWTAIRRLGVFQY